MAALDVSQYMLTESEVTHTDEDLLKTIAAFVGLLSKETNI